jgi:putative nucleotidyltransferase with HDIG domain
MTKRSVVRDIQPLQLLKEAVSSSDYVETTSVGFVLYDCSGVIVDCNVAATDYFQCERNDLLGRVTVPGVRLQTLDGNQLSESERPGIKSYREQRALKDVVVGIDISGKPLRWAKVSTRLLESGSQVEGIIAEWVDCTAEVERNRILDLGAYLLEVLETTHDPAKLLQSLCDVLVEKGRYPLAWIGTDADDGRGTVDVSFAAGAVDYLFDGIVSLISSEPTGTGPTANAFRTGEVVIAKDFLAGPQYQFWHDRAQEFGFYSVIAIPFHTDRPHVLTVYDRHAIAFDQAMIAGITGMTNTVALSAKVQSTLSELKQNLEATISSLGQITEERDPYTEGHQTRVGDLSAAIAQYLGFDKDTVDTIRLAGQVHDVGKIAVPAEILTRPGRLGALEYEMIKRHCEVGAKILAKACLPEQIVQVALQHHERLDGSGYPFGLRGDQISVPARVVAVADVVEAMMHHRPYRPALGLSAALKVITRGSGTLFDPTVVAACVAQFEAGFDFTAQENLLMDGERYLNPRANSEAMRVEDSQSV